MSLETYNCTFLELDTEISPESFDKARFFDDIKSVIANSEKQRMFAWSYGSTSNPEKEHSHILIDFRENKIRLKITFNYAEKMKNKIEDVRPPYMEDCAQWIASFINKDSVSAAIGASFVFSNDYVPVFALPFPLLNQNKELSGALVTGVKIKLPQRTVIIQKTKKGMGAHIDKKAELDLRNFTLTEQLQELSALVTGFFTVRGEKQ